MKNILLIIDMQNGFARYGKTKETGEKIVELLKTNSFDYVIATQFINPLQGPYRRILNWEKLTSSPEIDLLEEIEADYILKKEEYTSVNEELMKEIIRVNEGQKPNHIFLVGVDTDCCVMKTAVDLFEKDIRPIVLLNYCNSNGGKIAHQSGIQVMKRLIGAKQLINKIIYSKKDLEKIMELYN